MSQQLGPCDTSLRHEVCIKKLYCLRIYRRCQTNTRRTFPEVTSDETQVLQTERDAFDLTQPLCSIRIFLIRTFTFFRTFMKSLASIFITYLSSGVVSIIDFYSYTQVKVMMVKQPIWFRIGYWYLFLLNKYIPIIFCDTFYSKTRRSSLWRLYFEIITVRCAKSLN